MSMLMLRNHVVDILVHKINDFLGFDQRSQGEIDDIRTVMSILWPGKDRSQCRMVHGDTEM